MRAARTDKSHKPVLDAIRDILGYPCRSLHRNGEGVEDLLVGIPARQVQVQAVGHDLPYATFLRMQPQWLLVEVKTCLNKKGTVQPSQFTKAQREWYAQTEGFPRLVVTGPQDAIDQLRKMTERT